MDTHLSCLIWLSKTEYLLVYVGESVNERKEVVVALHLPMLARVLMRKEGVVVLHLPMLARVLMRERRV